MYVVICRQSMISVQRSVHLTPLTADRVWRIALVRHPIIARSVHPGPLADSGVRLPVDARQTGGLADHERRRRDHDAWQLLVPDSVDLLVDRRALGWVRLLTAL